MLTSRCQELLEKQRLAGKAQQQNAFWMGLSIGSFVVLFVNAIFAFVINK